MGTSSLHKSEKGNLVMTPRTTSEMLAGRWGWMFAPARDCTHFQKERGPVPRFFVSGPGACPHPLHRL